MENPFRLVGQYGWIPQISSQLQPPAASLATQQEHLEHQKKQTERNRHGPKDAKVVKISRHIITVDMKTCIYIHYGLLQVDLSASPPLLSTTPYSHGASLQPSPVGWSMSMANENAMANQLLGILFFKMMLEGQTQKWWFVLHIYHSADMMIHIWMMNSFRFLGFGIRDLLHVCFFPSQFPKLHYWLCHGVDGVLGKLMVRVRFVSKLGVRPRMASFLFHFLFLLKGNRSRNKIWCQILEVQSISTPNFKFISDFRGTIFCQWCSAGRRWWNGPSWLASVKVSPFARSCSKDWGNKLQDALSKASKYISSPENPGAATIWWKWNSDIYIIIYTYHNYV